jgi:hypothetical protein
MKKIFGLLAVTLLTLSSCKSYEVSYAVSLESVESPANIKQQFGDTKIVTLEDAGISKYRYTDNYIEITWFVDRKEFAFTLKNKSNHAIRINWDDISYVDISGNVGRVMHSGVKYTDRNNSQPATSIPKGASLSDILLPTDNVFFISPTRYSTGGWREKSLLPSFFEKETIDSLPQKYVGQKMSIMMPISIENVQNDYTFVFNVDKVLGRK